METNIIITGLEEYQQKLKEIDECISKLGTLRDELIQIVWKMKPTAEIKKAPEKTES